MQQAAAPELAESCERTRPKCVDGQCRRRLVLGLVHEVVCRRVDHQLWAERFEHTQAGFVRQFNVGMFQRDDFMPHLLQTCKKIAAELSAGTNQCDAHRRTFFIENDSPFHLATSSGLAFWMTNSKIATPSS